MDNFGETFKSFDLRETLKASPATCNDRRATKNPYVNYKKATSPSPSPEKPNLPMLLSQGMFDQQFEQTEMTHTEMQLMSPMSAANIMLPVKMEDDLADNPNHMLSKTTPMSPFKGSMTGEYNLQQQEEPLSDEDDLDALKTAEKIALFPKKEPSMCTRKQAIEEAENLLRMTETKVDLVNSGKNLFDQEVFHRSFYGEEKNEPRTRASDISSQYKNQAPVKKITDVRSMNQCHQNINRKMKTKYENLGNSFISHNSTQKLILSQSSSSFFKKPEDLRSKSGSKIGCGISKALNRTQALMQPLSKSRMEQRMTINPVA